MATYVYRMDDRPDAPSKAAIRCSLDEARDWVAINDSVDDAELSAVLNAASNAIDTRCGQTFDQPSGSASARLFRATHWDHLDLGMWRSVVGDPAGMIVKCAEASALRKAFPSTLAAMYCKEEMDREREAHRDAIPQVENRPKADRLAERLTVSTPIQSIIPPTIPAVVTEPVTVVPEASTEPAAEQQVDWLKKLLGMITRAMSPEDLDEIMYAAHDRTEEGVIEPVDYNAIKTAVEAKRNELK